MAQSHEACLLWLGFVALAGGWVTLPSDYSLYEGRKYAWSMSEDPLSDEGLSGGIAFAIDPGFCAAIRPAFREDKAGEGSLNLVNFITCDDINDALERAMTTWSANHPYIKFYNVSDECEREGNGADCSLAEMYVDARGPSEGLGAIAAFVVHNPSSREYSKSQWEAGVRLPSGTRF
jgi:hypothetical protein